MGNFSVRMREALFQGIKNKNPRRCNPANAWKCAYTFHARLKRMFAKRYPEVDAIRDVNATK